MTYVSPYLLNTNLARPSSKMRERRYSSAEAVLNDETLNTSEKHHILDKLEHEALAGLTMGSKHQVHGKSPALMLEEVMTAKRTLNREN